ncbi:MAG: M24 family metallopeptidase [Oscillospiraceae bacterium]|nr:M24 family metallopeptidase [Oscillospiraceae bacterium]
MDRREEVLHKVSLVRAELLRSEACGVLVREQPNFSWLTAGGRGFLGLAATVSCAWVLVTQDNLYILANSIEGGRIVREELPGDLFQLQTIPWAQDGGLFNFADKLAGGGIATDAEWGDWFAAVRTRLLPSEKDRFRVLGRNTASALEETLKSAVSGITEFEAAGAVSAALWSKGIEPISIFAGADERSEQVRHFIPTNKCANAKLILSVCARCGGLVISATRTVYFSEIAEQQKQKHYSLLKVEAEAFRVLEERLSLGNMFTAMCDAYTREGLKGEWEKHHQGGITGYLPRELRIDKNTERFAATGEAYAFNPSCFGAKVEDTVLLEENGIAVITPCGDWPVVTVNGLPRPDILLK